MVEDEDEDEVEDEGEEVDVALVDAMFVDIGEELAREDVITDEVDILVLIAVIELLFVIVVDEVAKPDGFVVDDAVTPFVSEVTVADVVTNVVSDVTEFEARVVTSNTNSGHNFKHNEFHIKFQPSRSTQLVRQYIRRVGSIILNISSVDSAF